MIAFFIMAIGLGIAAFFNNPWIAIVALVLAIMVQEIKITWLQFLMEETEPIERDIHGNKIY